MLIDWFTVGAQTLNFVILVGLMRRFLYKPVLAAIEAREKKIAAELADAAAKEAEATKQCAEFQHKNEDLDAQRALLLKRATDDANAERQRLLDEARHAADALGDKQNEARRNDADRLGNALRRRTQDEVFAIARRALTDLATTSLEDRMAEVFIRRLQEMDGQAKAVLSTAIKKAYGSIVLRSAFELSPDQCALLRDALNRALSADVPIRFETAPDLVSGIELTTPGLKLGWTIADYLGSLEKGVGDLLNGQDKIETNGTSKFAPGTKAEASAEPRTKADATHQTSSP